ncbi:PKD domain-containing protein [Halorussus limi]|uniref:PKD domain-containing protein n=1 Tax=Halorussus limi TaxID=2938695 RepID=A0A8U0HRH3_9EURY|nr:PKD domain-containing protein [Halorussus limi]UPV73487.1 PKD domain-containing protein [Halorussus limi]
MSKPTLIAVAVFLVVTTTAAGTIPTDDAASVTDATPANDAATPNEAPLADAGLDQDVTRGATVLLDATGSRDSDGRIERYEWSIRTPNGDTVAPDCADCARTRFTPTETGRYQVTITVTDDDGATRSDTLYVDVSPGSGPGVSVSGPTRPTEGSTATYTANLTVGAAALDYVVWKVDGTRIANHSLSAEQTTDAVTKHFPTAENRDVTATVYDADGLTNASSLTVAVQSDSDSPSESPESSTSTADGKSPRIAGDKVVTGSKPLRGRYDVRLDAPTTAVAAVEWRSTAGKISEGRSLTRTWEPGDHELYAVVTYADGSSNVATFADGTTTVTADPRPNVSFESLDRHGLISGAVRGVDEYENLNGLRVEVDGETVAVAGGTVRGRYRHDFGRQRTMRFSDAEFTPGEPYTVTVVATDERGQTVRASREIVPVEKPEIVRSEFVNGPVDSYHERLDPTRYAAHHVLEIDLNGVDPEKVDIQIQSRNDLAKRTDTNGLSRVEEGGKEHLVLHSFWFGESPGQYSTTAYVNYSNTYAHWESKSVSNFRVTPSKPELRLNVVNDGTKEYITREHGILVNASGSFDPDGTDLKYIWKYGAEPTKPDNSTAKFRSYERAASIVEDGYDLRAKRNFDFLNYFVPGISNTSVLSEEPYSDEETVRVQVETEPYHFAKETYYQDFSLGISVSNPAASVVEREKVEAERSGHSDATEDAYRYVWTIELPTESLASTTPSQTVTIYNRENARKKTEAELPQILVSGSSSKYWTDVTVQNLSYLVEKPRVRNVTVNEKETRDEYLKHGYEVRRTTGTTKYILEKKVKTQDAKYGTETKRFASRRLRKMFLQTSNAWYASGRHETQRTKVERFSQWHPSSEIEFKKKWHDSSLWNGERTGDTRRIKVESAEYRTQRKYRYENEIEKTKTIPVRRSKTRWVTKTATRTVERCSLRFGCEEVTQKYTYRTKETYTYRTTKTYTYTITKTETYWATSRHQSDHAFTGKKRRVKISDAVYETRFEVEYKTQRTETVTKYEAIRDKKVQDAVYEWRAKSETTDYVLARKQVSRNGWRMREAQATTWVLGRDDGTTKFWTPIYEAESDVVKTKATITGTLTTRSYDSRVGRVTEESELKSDTFTYEGAKSRQYIIGKIDRGEERLNWCRVKVACSKSNGGI